MGRWELAQHPSSTGGTRRGADADALRTSGGDDDLVVLFARGLPVVSNAHRPSSEGTFGVDTHLPALLTRWIEAKRSRGISDQVGEPGRPDRLRG